MNACDLFNEECDGQIMFISGYSNPKLRMRAQLNLKPTKVKIKINVQNYRGTDHYTAVGYLFDNDGSVSTKSRDITESTQAFYSRTESTKFYNDSIDNVINIVERFKESALSSKIVEQN